MRMIFQCISRAGIFTIALAVASIALTQEQPVSDGARQAGERQSQQQPSMQPVAGQYDSSPASDGIAVERDRPGTQESEDRAGVSPLSLIGTWVNVNQETGGLMRVVFARSGKEVTVHVFGACAPHPCDWGVVNGIIYAENADAVPAVAFSAKRTFSFEQDILVGHLVKGSLQIETLTHFTDESGRSDYYSLDVMSKESTK
jgi:hypothetical protein